MIRVLTGIGTNQPQLLDASAIPSLLQDEAGLVWIDLDEPDDGEYSVLTDIFHFHELTVEDCRHSVLTPPKVDDYGDYLFLIAHAIDFSVSDDSIVTTELDLYMGQNYVVTVHQRPMPSVNEIMARCQRQQPLLGRGPDWLTHAILDHLVDQLLPCVEAIDEEISGLEDEALDNPHHGIVARMGDLKRSTLRLRWLVAPQRDMVNRLGRGDFPHRINEATHMYFRDVHDHLVRLDVTIENLRDLGESVMAVYLATQGNRLNEVMKALGIVGVIFLPLTLISGVFGTNFDQTYQDSQWFGFGTMCVSFGVITLIMLAVFKIRKWF